MVPGRQTKEIFMASGNSKPATPSGKPASGAPGSSKSDKSGAKGGSATSKRNSQGGEQKTTGSKAS